MGCSRIQRDSGRADGKTLSTGRCLLCIETLPRRVRCSWPCAMPTQRARVPEQARGHTSPRKIHVTSKSPVGDVSVVTLIRTDTTLDHSQKAEKVCPSNSICEHCDRGYDHANSSAAGKISCEDAPVGRMQKGLRTKKRRKGWEISCWGQDAPSKIQEVTLMRPFHGNL